MGAPGPGAGAASPTTALVAAVRAEMAYYREHGHAGRDPESLAVLRERCAEVLSTRARARGGRRDDDGGDPLPPLSGLGAGAGRAAGRGLALVCVSNWDCSLPARAASAAGSARRLDGVVTSAGAGARKPDPAIFDAGARAGGCDGGARPLHVGDTAEEDVAGAAAAGIRALLLDRERGRRHRLAGRASRRDLKAWTGERVQLPAPRAGPRPARARRPRPDRRPSRTHGALPRAEWGPAQALVGLGAAAGGDAGAGRGDLGASTPTSRPSAPASRSRCCWRRPWSASPSPSRTRARWWTRPAGAAAAADPAARAVVPRLPGYVGCAILIALAIQPEQDDVTEQLGYGESALADVVVGILVIGVAPFTEEIFFRGFLFAGLPAAGSRSSRRRRSPPGSGASSTTRDAGTWGVVLQLAAFGVILSWLYERTGSIWPPIAVHAFNNASRSRS